MSRPVSSATPALALAALLHGLCAPGCGPAQPMNQRFHFVLLASTPAGEPVAGVRFFADGAEFGISNEHGELDAALLAREGASLLITANCPSGYRERSQPRRLQLHAYATADPSRVPALRLATLCEQETRYAALIVRALHKGQGLSLPIRVDAEVLGQTGSDGISHSLVTVSPHRSLRVALDTSAFPSLRPRDPVRTFPIDDDQDVLLFDQSFTEPPRHVPARPPRAAPQTHTPYRIR